LQVISSLLKFGLGRTEFLSNSKFVDDVDLIATCFDKTTKLRFRSIDEPQYIKFGGARDNDEMSGIRYGQMKLPGYEARNFLLWPI